MQGPRLGVFALSVCVVLLCTDLVSGSHEFIEHKARCISCTSIPVCAKWPSCPHCPNGEEGFACSKHEQEFCEKVIDREARAEPKRSAQVTETSYPPEDFITIMDPNFDVNLSTDDYFDGDPTESATKIDTTTMPTTTSTGKNTTTSTTPTTSTTSTTPTTSTTSTTPTTSTTSTTPTTSTTSTTPTTSTTSTTTTTSTTSTTTTTTQKPTTSTATTTTEKHTTTTDQPTPPAPPPPFNTTHTPGHETTVSPDHDEKFHCPFIGLFKDPMNCHGFYQCKLRRRRRCYKCFELIAYHHICSDNKWFSPISWTCVHDKPRGC